MLCSMRDLTSPTSDRAHAPALAAWNLNRWTTREAPKLKYFLISTKCIEKSTWIFLPA